MNRITKALPVLLLLCLGSIYAQAQERKKEFALSAGFATKLSDPFIPETAHGFHLGINMYNQGAVRFSSDAQFSLNYTNATVGATNILTLMTLYGVRMYFSRPERHTRIFMSLLGGFAFINESGDDFIENRPDVGYSFGLYLEAGRFVFGVAVETPTNAVFKVGYNF